MRVIYCGPFTGPLDLPTLGVLDHEIDQPLELTVDQGVQLCEQSNDWTPADAESQAELDAFCAWVAALTETHTKVYDYDLNEFVWQALEQPEPDPEPDARETKSKAKPRTTPAPAPADDAPTTTSPADAGDEGIHP